VQYSHITTYDSSTQFHQSSATLTVYRRQAWIVVSFLDPILPVL